MSELKFVFAIRDIKVSDAVSVEKNDVGTIKSESGNIASIFFIRIWQKVSLSRDDFVEILNIKETGDSFPKKICNICHKILPTIEFSLNQNAKNNRPVRRPSCKSCRRILEGIKMNLTSKVVWTKKKPVNVPFECPICRKRTIAGVTVKVVLDHDRVTGEPRGWICDSCNTGIGRFKDDITILQRAIKFLK